MRQNLWQNLWQRDLCGGEMGFLRDGYSPRGSASCTQQALRSCFISSSATYISKSEEADWSLALKMYFVCSVSVCFLVLVCITKSVLIMFPLMTFSWQVAFLHYN